MTTTTHSLRDLPEVLAGNMTAGGPSLRASILRDTGEDALTEPAFDWSNDLACDECGIHDSTAVVSFDGETWERLCHICYEDR